MVMANKENCVYTLVQWTILLVRIHILRRPWHPFRIPWLLNFPNVHSGCRSLPITPFSSSSPTIEWTPFFSQDIWAGFKLWSFAKILEGVWRGFNLHLQVCRCSSFLWTPQLWWIDLMRTSCWRIKQTRLFLLHLKLLPVLLSSQCCTFCETPRKSSITSCMHAAGNSMRMCLSWPSLCP